MSHRKTVREGVLLLCLVLGSPVFATDPRPVSPHDLLPAEMQEYASLLVALQYELRHAYPTLIRDYRECGACRSVEDITELSAVLGRWFRQIEYVVAVEVARPLYLSHPPRVHVRLAVALRDETVVLDDVTFTLPTQLDLFREGAWSSDEK